LESVFIDNITAEDAAYNNIRDGSEEWLRSAKKLIEELWGTYHPHADRHFLVEIRRDFHARFWEMYLACTLINAGHTLTSADAGPDIRIEHASKVIWIEAVTPTAGDPSKPDSVPDLASRLGAVVARKVPDEQIILRYRAAIQDKYFDKYYKYAESGIVADDDCYVIAVNGCRIPSARADIHPPRIVRSVLPYGFQQVTLDTASHTIVDSSWTYRPHLTKHSGSLVDTDIFLKPEYNHISAVMFSAVDAANPTASMGADFIVVRNPLALRELPGDLLKAGREYTAERTGDNITLLSRDLR
jgi:hypothetical protein